MGDPASARFIGGVRSRPIAWRGMATMAGSSAMKGFGMFSVVEKSSGRWIGRLGPWQPEGWPGTEIAWGLLPSAWGRGYAGWGAAAAIDWAFGALGWSEIIHCMDGNNLPSIRLAERLGSGRRGRADMPPPDDGEPVDIWGQTREEWRARG